MSEIGFTLSHSVSDYVVAGRTQGFRLVAEISATAGGDPNVFKYMYRGQDPSSGSGYATFESVCRPSDLETLPAGLPEDPEEYSCFRLAAFDMIFDSTDELQETLEALQEDLAELVRSLNGLESLSEPVETTFGDVPAESGSESSSASSENGPESSSEAPAECPEVPESLSITLSDDANFPVGTPVVRVSPETYLPGYCTSHWFGHGSGNWTLELDVATDEAIFRAVDGFSVEVVESASVSEDLKVMITYRYPESGFVHFMILEPAATSSSSL